MERVLFNPNGAPLIAKIVFYNGVIAAGYGLKLSEKNSNRAIFYYDGDNLNPEDDIYYLPMPVDINDERILRLRTDFYGLDLDNSKDYEIALEIHQGDVLLNKNSDIGKITGGIQNSLLFSKLIKQ